MRIAAVIAIVFLSLGLASGPASATALAEILKANAETERLDVDKVRALYDEAILIDGTVELAIQRLDLFSRTGNRASREIAFNKLTVAHLHWQYGDSERAMEIVDDSLAVEETTDAVLMKARLLDAGGDERAAVEWYNKALSMTASDEEREFIRIRLTMVDVDASNVAALVDLAGQRDQAFKNRAAVALAVLGNADRAIELYKPDPEAGKAFQQFVRQAEWAIAAGNLTMARDVAWTAYRATDSRVDSLYALALVVESYRKSASLPELIDHLESLPALNADLLQLRVDLLIETEQYDAAIDFYKALNGEAVDATARQRLIGLYVSAGRTDEMIAEYRNLMRTEPGAVHWYSGLAAHHMNNADTEGALEVWRTLESRNAENIDTLVAGAEQMLDMGFVNDAADMIERHMSASGENVQGLMFLFETWFDRGRDTEALDAVTRLESSLPPGSGSIRLVADAYERLGEHEAAVRVFERLQQDEGGLGYDEHSRLAWLYSVVGEKQKSLDTWRAIWVSVNSPARRSFSEAQFLLLAAELGTLADIVVEIEDKLYRQEADRNELNLLVRIYSEVGDSFSAAEVVEEYARYSGDSEIARLTQIARVYLQLSEYSKYDEVLRSLVEIDDENRIEHIQNLVLNMLAFDLAEGSEERFEEIERWLEELRNYDEDAVSGEFEASILSMGGFNSEAIESYRRALVESPQHSDNLLLMADLLKTTGRTDEAVSLLQYVAEHASGDNEFVVAIDGMINMIGQRRFGQDLPPDIEAKFRWTQRTILERITLRDDKFYLYTLLAEIAQETNDREAEFAAVENSLSQAGVRRPAILRELVTMSTPGAGFGFGGSNAGDLDRQITYGRRLVGLRQQLPPEVYITLGKTLLEQGDVQGAEKSFNRINDITGLIDVRETKAEIFKLAGYADEALAYYSQALSVDRDNPELVLETAVLRESGGQYDVANGWYLHALTNLLGSQLARQENTPPTTPNPRSFRGPPVDTSVNRDYRSYYEPLLQGLLLTWPDESSAEAERLRSIRRLFDEEMASVESDLSGEQPEPLARYSRLDHIAAFARRVAESSGNFEIARHVDGELLRHFADDADYANEVVSYYRNFGRIEFADRIARQTNLETNDAESSLLRSALNRAKADGQVEVSTKLALLAGFEDELSAIFREQIRSGNIRESLAYARTLLSDKQYRRLVTSAAPDLSSNRDALRQLLFTDVPLLQEMEQVLDAELLTARDAAEMLEVGNDRQLARLVRSSSGEAWTFIASKSGLDEQIELFGNYVERSGESSMQLMLTGNIMRNLLEQRMDASQRDAFSALAVQLFSSLNFRDTRTSMMLPPMILIPDAHPDNEEVLLALAETYRQRTPSSTDFAPAIRAVFAGEPNQALDELLDLYTAGALGTSPYQLYIWTIHPVFDSALERRKTAMTNGEVVDAEKSRLIYEALHMRQRLDAASDKLTEVAALQKALTGAFPEDSRYGRELISTYQLLGDSVRAEQEMAELYAMDASDEHLRAAYYFQLLKNERFERANALAADGGPDLRRKSTVDDLLAALDGERYVRPESSTAILQAVLGARSGYNFAFYDDSVKRDIESLRASIDSDDPAEPVAALRSVWRGIVASIETSSRFAGYLNPVDTVLSLPVSDNDAAAMRPGWPGASSKPPLISSITELIERGENTVSKTLLAELSNRPWAAPELEAWLRALSPARRRESPRLYELVADAWSGSDAAALRQAELTQRLQEGQIDDHDFTLWMLLLERSGRRLTESEFGQFASRVAAISEPTDLQLLAIARLFAVAGSIAESTEYYALLAARLTELREFADSRGLPWQSTFIDVLDLVADIAARLPATDAVALVEDILSVSAGADNNPLMQHYYDAFVLRSLGFVLEPEAVLQVANSLASSTTHIPAQPTQGETMKLVELAALHVGAGNVDAALTALTALVTQAVEPEQLDRSDPAALQRAAQTYRSAQTLAIRYGLPVLMGRPDVGGAADAVMVARRDRLFPATADETAVQWRNAAADALLQALDSNDVERDAAIAGLLTIAWQHDQSGDVSAAKSLLVKLGDRVLANREFVGPGSMRNLAAASMHFDTLLPLPLAREMLEDGALTPEEAASLLARIAEVHGADKALQIGRAIDTGQLALMRQLLALAEGRDQIYANDLQRRIDAAEAAKALIDGEVLQVHLR